MKEYKASLIYRLHNYLENTMEYTEKLLDLIKEFSNDDQK